MKANSVLETIGNTPHIRLAKMFPDAPVWIKSERTNPGGSIKDRIALAMIEAAEADGSLRPGGTIVEPTSGNTGIGLAMVCAQKGYPLVVVMAESFSIERRRLMRFLGAKVVLTPAAGRAMAMVEKAKELAKTHGWFLTRQFENPANPAMHSRTTAREIIRDFSDIGLDYWVTGYGTGGTLTGVARILKTESPATKIICCEPQTAQLLGSEQPQGRNVDGSPASAHPAWSPHPMQGWTPDFIPLNTQGAVDEGLIDEIMAVSGPEAMAASLALAQSEGLFVGITSGANFACALKVADAAPDGANILCMVADTGERYLSTPLFEQIPVDMTEAELAILDSSPLGRAT